MNEHDTWVTKGLKKLREIGENGFKILCLDFAEAIVDAIKSHEKSEMKIAREKIDRASRRFSLGSLKSAKDHQDTEDACNAMAGVERFFSKISLFKRGEIGPKQAVSYPFWIITTYTKKGDKLSLHEIKIPENFMGYSEVIDSLRPRHQGTMNLLEINTMIESELKAYANTKSQMIDIGELKKQQEEIKKKVSEAEKNLRRMNINPENPQIFN